VGACLEGADGLCNVGAPGGGHPVVWSTGRPTRVSATQRSKSGGDGMAILCIRLLEEALQVHGPVSVVREQVVSLDEEIMFIEVCLDPEDG
jgi:hypothetical protein